MSVAVEATQEQIGDLCDLINGRAFKPSEWTDQGLPIIRIQNLNDEAKPFNYFNGDYREQHEVNDGDLLFSWSGTPGTSFGAFFWNRGKGVLNQHIFNVHVDKKRVEKRYFRYAMNNRLDLIIGQAHGGVGLKHITKGRLEAVKIPLPPLSEQKRIADILDKADAIRRKRQQAIEEAEAAIHSSFLGIVGPSASEYKSWKPVEIESLAENKKGSMRTGPFGSNLKHSEFVDEGVAVLGIDNAVKNRFAWDERRYITHDKYEELKRYTVKPDDVIITIMATNGRSAVVPDDIPLAINTKHLACITLDKEKAEPEFVSNAIHRHPHVMTQLGAKGRGAIMTGLNLGIIKKTTIPLPPIEVQRQFTQALNKLRELESRLESSLSESNDLFNSLVQRAFKGEL